MGVASRCKGAVEGHYLAVLGLTMLEKGFNITLDGIFYGRRMAKIIVFEGIDGAGKTLMSKAVATSLGEHAEHVDFKGCSYISRVAKRFATEPGVPSELREALHLAVMDETIRLRIMRSERKFVICDRYIPSMMAYNCPLGFNKSAVKEAIEHIPTPEAVIYLHIDYDTMLQRCANLDFYESLGREYYQEVIAYYDQQHAIYDRWHYIDASKRITDVLDDCNDLIRKIVL